MSHGRKVLLAAWKWRDCEKIITRVRGNQFVCVQFSKQPSSAMASAEMCSSATQLTLPGPATGRSSVKWDSPEQNTKWLCHSFLQDLPSRTPNPCLLHWQAFLPLSHTTGKPTLLNHRQICHKGSGARRKDAGC